jgi:hypothetical protein
LRLALDTETPGKMVGLPPCSPAASVLGSKIEEAEASVASAMTGIELVTDKEAGRRKKAISSACKHARQEFFTNDFLQLPGSN